MEFPFPPEPPGYTIVLVARGFLLAWAVIGAGILVLRLRQWKFIRPHETVAWVVAGGISWFVAAFASCSFLGFDNNEWLWRSVTAASFVSVAGIVIGILKLYNEGDPAAARHATAIAVSATLILGFVCLPALGHPREASNRVQCKNNIKQIGLAMFNYESEHGNFPPSASGDKRVSWRVTILPYIDQMPLFKRYNPRREWDHAINDKVALRQMGSLMCSSNYESLQDTQARWFTAYSMPTGPHAIGENPTGTTMKDITDGSSNTLLVVEACGAQIVWTEPRDVNVATDPAGINQKGTRPGHSASWLSSYHYGGAYVGMADGSARFLSTKTDPVILKRLATIDGGEFVKTNELP